MTTVSLTPEPRVEPRRLRSVLGRLPTGVTLVTTMYDGQPVALVIGSFVSISLDPPLAGFFVDHRSTRWPLIRNAGRFAVNVLAEDQANLCDRFAHRRAEGFQGLTWRLSPLGSPVLGGVAAWIDCRLEATRLVGDHVLAVGRVDHLEPGADRSPLVFWRGSLLSVATEPPREA